MRSRRSLQFPPPAVVQRVPVAVDAEAESSQRALMVEGGALVGAVVPLVSVAGADIPQVAVESRQPVSFLDLCGERRARIAGVGGPLTEAPTRPTSIRMTPAHTTVDASGPLGSIHVVISSTPVLKNHSRPRYASRQDGLGRMQGQHGNGDERDQGGAGQDVEDDEGHAPEPPAAEAVADGGCAAGQAHRLVGPPVPVEQPGQYGQQYDECDGGGGKPGQQRVSFTSGG